MAMNRLLLAAALIAMAGTAPAFASADLAKSKKCLECHAVDKEVKGPSFKAVAKLYKGTDKAEASLAAKIKKGCADHWGPDVMPPGGIGPWNVSDAEAKSLAQWILKQ
jgi:cytochrome c